MMKLRPTLLFLILAVASAHMEVRRNEERWALWRWECGEPFNDFNKDT